MPERSRRPRPKGMPDRGSTYGGSSGASGTVGRPARGSSRTIIGFGPGGGEDFAGSPAERLDEIRRRLLEARGEVEARLDEAGLIPDPELTIEVFDEGDNVVCVADCPGVEEADVSARVEAGHVHIDAETPKGHRHGMGDLPALVVGEPTVAVRNGVVEVRLRRKEAPGTPDPEKGHRQDEKSETEHHREGK